MFFFFFYPSTVAQKPEWGRFADALHHVRTQHPTMTIGTLSTMIEIARHHPVDGPPPKLSELSSQLKVPYPTLMRQTDLLSNGVGNTKGLGLIEKQISSENRRERSVNFTLAGQAFLTELDALLTPPKEPAEAPA